MFLPVRGGLVSSTQQMSSVMETMSESGGFTSEDACFDLYEDEMIILKVNCQRLSGIMGLLTGQSCRRMTDIRLLRWFCILVMDHGGRTGLCMMRLTFRKHSFLL